jgi:DNA-binding transcriptional regulator YdaS (Cro superfamily)
MSKDLVRAVIEAAGGQVTTAQRCGVTQPAVSHWIAKGRIPATHCITIEELCCRRYTRYQMRPDVFGSHPHEPARQIDHGTPAIGQLEGQPT